jgi:DNA polymerase I-like protein with 3'-5' exonuclease and polymerase domains
MRGFLGEAKRGLKPKGVQANTALGVQRGWAGVSHLCTTFPGQLKGRDPEGNAAALLVTGFPSEDSARLGTCYSPSEVAVFERLAAKHAFQPNYLRRMAVESIAPVRVDEDKRTPNTAAYVLEAYSNHVGDCVRRHKPNLVILSGAEAVKAVLGDGSVESYRGKPLRAHLGGRRVWVFVIHSAAEMARIEAEGRHDKVGSEEWRRIRENDIIEALSPAYIARQPEVVSVAEAKDAHEAAGYTDLDAIERAVASFGSTVAFDIETNGLRPYRRDSKILSLGLSDGETSVCFPVNHPQHKWGAEEITRLVALVRGLFTGDRHLVAHNLPFDLEWMAHFFGPDILTSSYGDTLGQAFVVNPGPPGGGSSGLSLGQLCRQYFGFSLKKLTEGAAAVTRLESADVDQVCEYNALDAYWTARLHRELTPVVEKSGQGVAYEMHMARIPALVQAQLLGVPVDQEIRARLAKQGREEVKRIEGELSQMEEVRGSSLNPHSPSSVGEFIIDVLKDDRIRDEEGKVSTRRDTLEIIAPDHRSVQAILDIRNQHKLVSTFVDRFDPEHDKALCFPDGKVHGTYKVSGTRTGRLSSSEPNLQNIPKRRAKHVRSQFSAPEGWVWLACDQGQIEARVLAMASKDENWVQSIWAGTDVHMEWTERAAQVSPRWARMIEEDRKGARGIVKNAWVFPAFYGSSFKSIARNMGFDQEGARVMDDAEGLFNEFWQEFSGIKKWQENLWENYKKTGVVRSLTGRVRVAPLSWNMVINSGIQGAASDITVDAHVRLWRRSVQDGKPWLTPRWLIHDDLAMLVPLDEVQYAAQALVSEQLNFDAPWVNVPLSAELEVGVDYSKMIAVETWRSDEEVDVSEKLTAALEQLAD